jgi:hypothetical protein
MCGQSPCVVCQLSNDSSVVLSNDDGVGDGVGVADTVSSLLTVVGRVLQQSWGEFREAVAVAAASGSGATDVGARVRRRVEETSSVGATNEEFLQSATTAATTALNTLSTTILRDALAGEEPITSEGGGLTVTVGVVSLEEEGTDLGSLLSLGSTVRPRLRSLVNSTVILRRLLWNVNPYAFAPTSALVTSGVVTVEVLDMQGRPLSVGSDAVEPSTFALSLDGGAGFGAALGSTPGMAPQCAYFDVLSGAWVQQGVVLMGFDTASGVPLCATLHFTDFAGLAVPGALAASVYHGIAGATR